MLCPKCKVALRISRSYTKVTGDESPDTETKVFTVQELECRNPKCEDFGKVVKTAEHPMTVTR